MRKEAVKRFFFPEIDGETRKIIDDDSIRNIYFLSLAMVLFEMAALIGFLLSRKDIGTEDWISMGSVAFCTVTCLAGYLIARRFMRKKDFSSSRVTVFKIAAFLVLSVWSVWTSYRQYHRGEQILTFYTVELLLACFIPLRPWQCVLLQGSVYAALYGILYTMDGARGINLINYLALALVSVVGMMIRYRSLIRMAEATVSYQKVNGLLQHQSRHDGLTGLRNRTALEEDIPKYTGKPVAVHMIDINYFKEVNDTYGHTAGDALLRETAARIRELFPEASCYRYGGDEFLILGETVYPDDSYRFTASTGQDIEVRMNIGSAKGTPENQEELFQLIMRADDSLYEAKRKTHLPENGGRERRKARIPI